VRFVLVQVQRLSSYLFWKRERGCHEVWRWMHENLYRRVMTRERVTRA
jgi:hypothetical protein